MSTNKIRVPSLIIVFICFSLLFSYNIQLESYSETGITKNVLLLNSYHKGYLWTDEITRGIEDTFSNQNIDLHIEYMDTKRQFNEEYQNILIDLLTLKHSNNKYDLIITTDDNAFNFVLDFGDDIFGDTPHVFCGVNYLDERKLESKTNITGISEQADIRSNIDLIRDLHPESTEIVVIVDDTTTGRRIKEEISIIQLELENSGYKLIVVSDINFQGLKDYVSTLDTQNPILFLVFFIDNEGVFLEYDDSLKLVFDNTEAPIYGTWDFQLNNGIIGGYLVEGYNQGVLAANDAMMILNGKNADNIKIDYSTTSKLIFDYNIMKLHQITASDLPFNSKIINEPNSFYQDNKTLILNTVLIIVLLILALIGVSYNYIKLKKIKIDLHESEDRLQLALEGASLGTWDWNLITDVRINSARWAEIIGYSSDEIRTSNITWESLIHPDDFAFTKKVLDYHLTGQTKYFESEYRLRNKIGNWVWILAKGKVLERDLSGNPIRACGTYLDITTRKEQEIELKERTEELSELNSILTENKENLEITVKERTKELENTISQLKLTQNQLVESKKMASLGGLVAGVAHEINTPVGISITLASHLNAKSKEIFDIYKSEELSQSRLQNYITMTIDNSNMILENMQKAANLIQNFKQVAIDQSTQEHRRFKLNEYLNEIIQSLSPKFNSTNYNISINCPDDLIIESYPGLIFQVITSLVSNSLKHGFDGLNSGSIIINVTENKDDITLSYGDTGKGIASDIIQKIYEPFFTTKRGKGNTGLGMHIVYNIVTQTLKGSIVCQSEENEGTVFIITIPKKLNA